jgi:hypothetical protein
MLRHLRFGRQLSRLAASVTCSTRVAGCHSLSPRDHDRSVKIERANDLALDPNSSSHDLEAQLDNLSIGDSPPPYDLNSIPVSNAELRNDYRMKQFVASENEDLMQSLRSARSKEQLISVVAQNEKRMMNRHVSQAFTTLFTIGRSSPNRSKFVSTLSSDPDFKRLCQLAVYKMRFMESNEVVSVFKCLTFLSISQKSLLFNGCLQMIRHQINEFEADELVLLDFLFTLQRKQSEEVSGTQCVSLQTIESALTNSHFALLIRSFRGQKNNLLETLCSVIPIVFESKIRNKEIDFTEIDALLRYFSLASSRKLNGKYVNQLLLAIKMQQNNSDFNDNAAIKVLSRIATLSFDTDLSLDIELMSQVCTICTNKLLLEIESGSEAKERILSNLLRMYKRVLNRHILDAFYNKPLLDHVIDYAIDDSNKSSVEEMYFLIYNMSVFAHYDKKLLEKFYFTFLENYELYMNTNSMKPGGLVFAYFTPLQFDKFDLKHLLNLVLNPKKMVELRKEFDALASIIRNLSSLRIYEPIEVFEDFFKYLYKDNFHPLRRKYILRTLRTILIDIQEGKAPECFKTHQSRIKQLLSEAGNDGLFCIYSKFNKKSALSEVYGSDKFLDKPIKTRDGFLLDQVAIYDSSQKQFIAIDPQYLDLEHLEDIPLLENQHL